YCLARGAPAGGDRLLDGGHRLPLADRDHGDLRRVEAGPHGGGRRTHPDLLPAVGPGAHGSSPFRARSIRSPTGLRRDAAAGLRQSLAVLRTAPMPSIPTARLAPLASLFRMAVRRSIPTARLAPPSPLIPPPPAFR